VLKSFFDLKFKYGNKDSRAIELEKEFDYNQNKINVVSTIFL